MKRLNKWGTGTTIGVLVLAVLSNVIAEKVKDVPILSSITQAFTWLTGRVVYLLNYPVKVWVVLAVIAGLLLLYYAIKATYKIELKYPDWINYKKGILRYWKWSWDWEKTTDSWEITKLTPFCPKDG